MPIEEQLLPSKELQPYYDKVSWLYVCRLFKDGDPKDIEAVRSHDRFGVSSWPQMMLFDPATDRVIQSPPRQLERFKRTFDDVLRDWQPSVEVGEKGRQIAAQMAEAKDLLKRGKKGPARKILQEFAAGEDAFEARHEARELLREHKSLKRGTLLEQLNDSDERVRRSRSKNWRRMRRKASASPRVRSHSRTARFNCC